MFDVEGAGVKVGRCGVSRVIILYSTLQSLENLAGHATRLMQCLVLEGTLGSEGFPDVLTRLMISGKSI